MSTPISTGPITETGKAQSAQNAITHGLSSELHLIRREDAAEFEALSAQFQKDLSPGTTMETILFKEIARASWRLERCARAEDAALNDENQPAIDRARATALNIILKATAELRRLQTNRNIAIGIFPEGTDLSDLGIANQKEMIAALAANERRLTIQSKRENGDHLDDLFHQADRRISREYAAQNPPAPDSSFCKTAETTAKPPIPRNSPCPCEVNRNQRLKKKYKQCCGKDAPPVLHHGAKKAA